MAVHTKTVEYAFPTNFATVATAVRTDLAAITLYLPETTSRTFRSVHVEVSFRGAETTAASITARLIGIKLGAVAFNDESITRTLANTGDAQSWTFIRDVTSYFASNFGAAASQTCQVGCTITGIGTSGLTAKLVITYECEDQDTRVKTVRIPIESSLATLTNTLAELGTNQVPLLDTFLPEATKTFRNIFFECSFNDASSAVTDVTLSVALDAAAETDLYFAEQALNTATAGFAIYVNNAMDTSAVHAFKARCDNTTARFSLAVVLVVTYEYSHTTSVSTDTGVLNSLKLPFAFGAKVGGTTSADKQRWEFEVWVEEPATVTVRQSGVFGWYHGSAATTTMSIGHISQTVRAYVLAQGVTAGAVPVVHRIDSSGGGGGTFTLSRGKNTIYVDVFENSLTAGGTFSGWLLINYTSDIHASGDGVHNKSLCYIQRGSTDAGNGGVCVQQAQSTVPLINEASYFINDVGIDLFAAQVTSAVTVQSYQIDYEWAAGEGPGAGYFDCGVMFVFNDGESNAHQGALSAKRAFNQWPNDIRDVMDIETSRNFRFLPAIGIPTWGATMWVTYHSITFAIAGDVANSAAGSVTITAHIDVACQSIPQGMQIGSTSRTGNGAYSITWYDNVSNTWVRATEDATHLGTSVSGIAV